MSSDDVHVSDYRSLDLKIRDSSIPQVPTRIILRLYVKDFDSNGFSWFDYPSAIEAYLEWSNRSAEDWREKKHNIFVEQFQQPEVEQKRFHVIVDLNSRSYDVENMDYVHHEIYEVKRNNGDGKLHVLQAKKPEVAHNIIQRTRYFTDKSFPWGSEGWEKLAID